MYPPLTSDQLIHLPTVISAPRFATYLREKNNDKRAALDLYHWNLQISAALLVPLHIVEVSTRNAIVEAIEAIHGGTWPWTQGFIRSLTDPGSPAYSPKRDLSLCAQRHPTAGKVVAELKFVFWEKMLTSRFQNRLWDQQFFAVFPDCPRIMQSSQGRARLREDIERVRKLRNRIAHHEPIFSRHIRDDLEGIMRCIRWRNQAAASWVEEIETVTAFLRIRP